MPMEYAEEDSGTIVDGCPMHCLCRGLSPCMVCIIEHRCDPCVQCFVNSDKLPDVYLFRLGGTSDVSWKLMIKVAPRHIIRGQHSPSRIPTVLIGAIEARSDDFVRGVDNFCVSGACDLGRLCILRINCNDPLICDKKGAVVEETGGPRLLERMRERSWY
ncbi:hypothetical protein B0O99DRAFT_715329 [Bisporella sp. PMI_857]|nr:hypothetical protein B0O99DRAFT_715329 [Bisporella sp. PMI_857]